MFFISSIDSRIQSCYQQNQIKSLLYNIRSENFPANPSSLDELVIEGEYKFMIRKNVFDFDGLDVEKIIYVVSGVEQKSPSRGTSKKIFFNSAYNK